MRYITVLLLVVTFVWWVILLVSIFVSPPGLHSRGSGFFDFSYTSLAFANLLVLLLFFASPSKATQITCLATSVLLLVDMIMIVAIPRLRVEEGWVGIASVIWALLVSIWVVVTDRVVQYGKQEEEERLTGRAESRRTMSEWLAVLVTEIVLVAIGLVIFLMSCTLIIRARDASLPVPGERYYVDGDKFQLHLYCSDPANPHSNLPTILFEAGERPFGHSFITVAENALKNGTINRYCYSDRPGFGWSDNAPSPFSAGMAVDVLSEALARAGEEGPWVLASAGVGSIYQRVFSSRKGESIRGILMVDPLHEDLLNRIGNTHHGFMLWLRGVLSPLGIDRILGAVFRGRTREDRVYGRSAYQNGKYIKAKLQESLVAESLTKNEIGSARAIQRLDVPVAVISSGVQLRKDSVWEGKQRELTHITRNLLGWDIVENAGHQVWETLEGRTAIEKRLGELVREAAK
jgi:pimeloyl-ACP methyl ester carboxylesterase